MRVRVYSVKWMPYDGEVWVHDDPDVIRIYILAQLITDEGARRLELALNSNTEMGHWRRLLLASVAS